MTIKLADGRNELWQWDTGRKVAFDDETVKQAHFQNYASGYGRTIDVNVENGEAKIPDELLQTAMPLTVYAYIGEESNGYTKVERVFTVKQRKRPAEYVFMPTEQLTLRQLQQQIGDLDDLKTYNKDNLVAAINEARQSGGGGGGGYQIGPGLKLDAETNTLSVDTAEIVEKDNTKPVTSAAVFAEVGNINALLATI